MSCGQMEVGAGRAQAWERRAGGTGDGCAEEGSPS